MDCTFVGNFPSQIVSHWLSWSVFVKYRFFLMSVCEIKLNLSSLRKCIAHPEVGQVLVLELLVVIDFLLQPRKTCSWLLQSCELFHSPVYFRWNFAFLGGW